MRIPVVRLICIAAIVLLLVTQFSAVAMSAEPVRVIVGFKQVADTGVLRSFGAQITYIYQYIPAIAASISPLIMDTLKNYPQIAYVEPDYEVHASGDYPEVRPGQTGQQTSWGVSKIAASDVWTSFNDKGAGVKVAVLDTGIDTKHPDLKVVGGVSYVSFVSSYNDDNGHGTHVGGIVSALDNSIGVVGVAPAASLYAVKVLNSQGSGYISAINKGIEWSITNKMQVVSMSFGSTSDSTSLHQECDKAYNAGIVLVAAAGNSGPGANTVNYPAVYSSVISVGATDSNDVIASFSSRGSQLSVTAPGVSVYSTYKGATYSTMSGTSMACPHVTGAVALILGRAPHTPAEIRTILQDNAVDLGTSGWDSTYGYGRIDAYKAVSASGVSTITTRSVTTSATTTSASVTTSTRTSTTSTRTSTTSTRTTTRWSWTWPWGRSAATATTTAQGQNAGLTPAYGFVPFVTFGDLAGMLVSLFAVLGIIVPAAMVRARKTEPC